MQATEFHKHFKCVGPAILPVIHVLDGEQALRNLRVVVSEGAQGAFLINHDFGIDAFLPIIRTVREAFPNLWLGVNFLAVTGDEAFPILADLEADGVVVDGYWADDACIDERADTANQPSSRADHRGENPMVGPVLWRNRVQKAATRGPSRSRASGQNRKQPHGCGHDFRCRDR